MTRPLLTSMKHGAYLIGEGFTKPDDDWAPVLVYKMPNGVVRHMVVNMPCDLDDRDAVAEGLTVALREANAVEAVLVVSAWAVAGDRYDPDTEPRPAEHPCRIEVLTITYVTTDEASVESALICRVPGKPPTLGKWGPPARGLAAEGRFINAMRLGVA